MPGGGLDDRFLVANGLDRLRAGKDPAAAALERGSQAVQVLQRMELSLVLEAQAGAALEAEHASVGHPVGLRVGGPRGLELFVELLDGSVLPEEEIAVHALEPAIDMFLVADGLDAIDRSCVTVARQARAIRTVETQHLSEALVDDVRKMSGGDRRLAVADAAGVDDDDRSSFPRQQVRRRESRDARADYADVPVRVLRERPGCQRVLRCRHVGS